MSQIDQRGRIALLTAEGVFIDPQHLGATAARQLPDPLRDKGLIPTLNGGTANPVRARQLALTHAPIMGLEDLQARSEEHTSELQSLMRISYAVFCLKKKNKQNTSINVHT